MRYHRKPNWNRNRRRRRKRWLILGKNSYLWYNKYVTKIYRMPSNRLDHSANTKQLYFCIGLDHCLNVVLKLFLIQNFQEVYLRMISIPNKRPNVGLKCSKCTIVRTTKPRSSDLGFLITFYCTTLPK
jgi:hypothetical protein